MSTIRRGSFIRRNDRCPCGTGKKFKHCCSPTAVRQPQVYSSEKQQYIDTGERPIRWVIMDSTGKKFFADKDNRALVFQSHADAVAIAHLEEFKDQDPGEINVAGVGPTKWDKLRDKIPFVEVDAEQAFALVRERIEYGKAGELVESKYTGEDITQLDTAPETEKEV